MKRNRHIIKTAAMAVLCTVIVCFALLSTTLSSCKGVADGTKQGDTIHFKYATLITAVKYDGYTEVSIANPWDKGKTLHRYALMPQGSTKKEVHGSTMISTPLKHSVVFTTVHCALLQDLKAANAIAGVCDLEYIKLPEIQQACKEGSVIDCGDAFTPDIEKIITLNADALLLSPFENSGGYGKLDGLDIPVIECAEYMEPTPLGRAEWMKFYGMLYGKQELADSLFNEVEKHYQQICKQAKAEQSAKPKVMMDKMTSGTWYVPGGQSTMATLINDAGGNYIFSSDTHSGSVPMNFEAVLDKCHDADIWIYRYSGNKDLAKEDKKYLQFKPLKQGQAWGCDVSSTLFYEVTPFHPDLLLEEFHNIIKGKRTNNSFFSL